MKSCIFLFDFIQVWLPFTNQRLLSLNRCYIFTILAFLFPYFKNPAILAGVFCLLIKIMIVYIFVFFSKFYTMFISSCQFFFAKISHSYFSTIFRKCGRSKKKNDYSTDDPWSICTVANFQGRPDVQSLIFTIEHVVGISRKWHSKALFNYLKHCKVFHYCNLKISNSVKLLLTHYKYWNGT